MKRVITTWMVLAAVLVVVAGAPTDAQAIGGYVSYWNAKDIDDGYGLGVKHSFLNIIPIVGIEGRVSWLRFENGGHKIHMIPFEAAGSVKLGILYGGLGAGYYFFDGDDPNPDNTFGGFLFGGGEFGLLGLGAFAELKYTWVEPDFEGGTADVSGFGINLGVKLGR